MSAPYRLLDLFSGIGGFSLGLERSGAFETVAFCEIEKFPRKILSKHWPEVPIYDDVRKLDAARLAADGIAVDAICGGFPCQDISLAGAGAGIAGERSGLWSEYRRLIGELRPRYVLVENVAALLDRGFDTVLGDLAALGYDAEWRCIPACLVGLPQERDRIWIAAYPMRDRRARLFESLDFSAYGQRRSGGTAHLQQFARFALQPGSGFPQPLLRRVDDRPAHWVDRVRACGNAVVPQIPEVIGRAILRADIDRKAAQP